MSRSLDLVCALNTSPILGRGIHRQAIYPLLVSLLLLTTLLLLTPNGDVWTDFVMKLICKAKLLITNPLTARLNELGVWNLHAHQQLDYYTFLVSFVLPYLGETFSTSDTHS